MSERLQENFPQISHHRLDRRGFLKVGLTTTAVSIGLPILETVSSLISTAEAADEPCRAAVNIKQTPEGVAAGIRSAKITTPEGQSKDAPLTVGKDTLVDVSGTSSTGNRRVNLQGFDQQGKPVTPSRQVEITCGKIRDVSTTQIETAPRPTVQPTSLPVKTEVFVKGGVDAKVAGNLDIKGSSDVTVKGSVNTVSEMSGPKGGPVGVEISTKDRIRTDNEHRLDWGQLLALIGIPAVALVGASIIHGWLTGRNRARAAPPPQATGKGGQPQTPIPPQEGGPLKGNIPVEIAVDPVRARMRMNPTLESQPATPATTPATTPAAPPAPVPIPQQP